MIGLAIKKIYCNCFSSIGRVFVVGVILSILSITMVIGVSFSDGFLKAPDKYDYIVGASNMDSKVSLNSIYFVDVPRKEISYEHYTLLKDIKTLTSIVPLKQVDMYKGLQVIGTTRDFFKGETVVEGRLFSDKSREVVIGSNVAKAKNLFVGSKIELTHRTFDDGGMIGDKAKGPDDGKSYNHEGVYTVVGIVESSTVYDNLVYMDIEDSFELHGGTKVIGDTTVEVKNVSGLLVNTGDAKGLSDLQKTLKGDKGVTLYDTSTIEASIVELRAILDFLSPVLLSIIVILIVAMVSLVFLGGVCKLELDIKALHSIKIPKRDLIVYVAMHNLIVLILGVLLTSPITKTLIKLLNALLSKWSVVLSGNVVLIVNSIAIMAIVLYVCMLSLLMVNRTIKEV